MVDIATGPLTKRAYELCLQADRLPYAGLELTALNTALSEFMAMCETHEKAATRALVKYKEWEDRIFDAARSIKHDVDCPRRREGRALPKCDCALGEFLEALEIP